MNLRDVNQEMMALSDVDKDGKLSLNDIDFVLYLINESHVSLSTLEHSALLTALQLGLHPGLLVLRRDLVRIAAPVEPAFVEAIDRVGER